MDCYTNTFDDMQNEKYFYGYCNEFKYNHDFEKIDGALSEYEVLDSNVIW